MGDKLGLESGQQLDPAFQNTPDGEFITKTIDVGKGVSKIYEPYSDPTPDWTWDLVASQHFNAGTLKVHNDSDTLYVEYSLFGFMMDEAAVLVSSTPPGPKEGQPGHFPYKVEFDDPVDTYTFEIPLAGFDGKGALYVAAYAHTTGDDGVWAGYFNGGNPYWDFNWKKWGGGIATGVMPVPDLPNGPGDSVSYMGYHWGYMSYWDVVFTTPVGLPPGSYGQSPCHPPGDYYVGWCVDQGHCIRSGYPYNVLVYSSYDPNKPDWADSDNWDMVNYLINQRRHGVYGSFTGYSCAYTLKKNAFENALWYFIGVVAPPGLGITGVPDYDPSKHDLYDSLITDALANGDNYIPGPGDYYALVLFDRDRALTNEEQRFQMNIIEVDP